MKRYESREQALTFLFENDFGFKEPNEILELAKDARDEKISNFSKELFLGTIEHLEDIDKEIESNSSSWKKDRLSKMVLSILRLSVFEMLYYSTPSDIAINEAVELAKKYTTKDDASYINGVLGEIARKKDLKNENK